MISCSGEAQNSRLSIAQFFRAFNVVAEGRKNEKLDKTLHKLQG